MYKKLNIFAMLFSNLQDFFLIRSKNQEITNFSAGGGGRDFFNAKDSIIQLSAYAKIPMPRIDSSLYLSYHESLRRSMIFIIFDQTLIF